MGVSKPHTSPRTPWKTVTPQRLFLMQLGAEVRNFGHVALVDRDEFLVRMQELDFLRYEGKKEYNGVAAKYNVLQQFAFTIEREDGYSNRLWLSMRKGDTLLFTESLLDKDNHHSDGTTSYKVWIDIPDRAAYYAA